MRVGELKRGMTIKYDGELYTVEEFEHSKRGRGDAQLRVRLRHVLTGRLLAKTLQGSDEAEAAFIEERPLQYLYSAGEEYTFMDNESFEQYTLNKDQLQDVIPYLKDGAEVRGLFHEGKILKVIAPTFVELVVARTEPGVRGDTVSGGEKPATLETGVEVRVPLFVKPGDRIKVDTRDGRYIERVG